MYKPLVALVISGAMSVSAAAQTAPPAPGAQPAKPQTVKKRVCTYAEEDSYSRLGGRKICKTIEVPVKAEAATPQAQQQAPAQQPGASN